MANKNEYGFPTLEIRTKTITWVLTPLKQRKYVSVYLYLSVAYNLCEARGMRCSSIQSLSSCRLSARNNFPQTKEVIWIISEIFHSNKKKKQLDFYVISPGSTRSFTPDYIPKKDFRVTSRGRSCDYQVLHIVTIRHVYMLTTHILPSQVK